MTQLARTFSRGIYTLNQMLGKGLSILVGAMAVTVFVIVTMRSLFNHGSIALQESVTYMHALVFMACLAFTAQQGGHVRVDIFYRRLSPEGKAWINVCGAIVFLLPFSLFLLAISRDFVLSSWRVAEGSINPGGIAAVYVLKSLIPLAGTLLALRCLAEVIDQLLVLLGVDAGSATPSR